MGLDTHRDRRAACGEEGAGVSGGLTRGVHVPLMARLPERVGGRDGISEGGKHISEATASAGVSCLVSLSAPSPP